MTLMTRNTPPDGVPSLTDPVEPSIMQLMAMALEKGGDAVSQIERLVDMKLKLDALSAAREFNRAMADFQAECPPIAKSSTARIMTKGGTSYSYQYAELDEIARTVNPLLARHGLSYSWDSEFAEKSLTCICTVRHINGHSVPAKFALPIDNPSAMNDQQKVGAALTFAKRYSLISALGIVTGEPDSDGADPATISDEQQTLLQAKLEEYGLDRQRFLSYMKVRSLAEIPATNFTAALNAIETRKRERDKAGAK